MSRLPVRQKATGFLGTGKTGRDWLVGGLRGDLPPVLLKSPDWTGFLPEGERQSRNGVETMSCVSHSFLNVLETHSVVANLGLFDFSDRALAKASETSENGNYMWKVWDTARKLGLCAEPTWTWNAQIKTWADFYRELPQAALNEMAKFVVSFDIGLAWVDETDDNEMNEALHRTPLWCANKTHAFAVIGEGSKSNYKVFDSYAGNDGDFIGEMPKSSICAAAMVWLKPKIKIPSVELKNDTLTFDAEKGRVGVAIGNRMYLDDVAKILATWSMRSPEFSRKVSLTSAQFDSFDHYNLKNIKLN